MIYERNTNQRSLDGKKMLFTKQSNGLLQRVSSQIYEAMKMTNEAIYSALYCRLFKNVWLTLLLTLLALTNVTKITAQNEPPADAKRGIANGASYSVSDIENINLTNGNLMMSIPLVNLPKGRGSVGQSLGLVYNSKLYETGTDQLQDITGQMSLQRRLLPDYTGGWHYSPRETYSLMVSSRLSSNPMSPCDGGYEWGKNAYVFKVEMTFPDGSTKMFRPAGYTDYYSDDYYNISANGYQYYASSSTVGTLPDGSPSYACNLTDASVTTDPMVYYSTDGSYLKLVVEHSNDPQNKRGENNPWTLYFPDGGKITGGTNTLTKIYDRNGNFVEGLNDNVGRSISVTLGGSQNEDLVKVKGFNNEEIQYVVRWKNIYVQREYETEAVTGGTQRGNPSEQVHQGEYRVIDEIILPPQMGSLTYQFEYHASDTPLDPGQFSSGWGELKSVTLPSGAQVNYEYIYQSNPIFQNQPRLKDVLRFFVNKKTLSYNTEYDGVTTPVSEIWNYSVGLASSTMTAPDGSVTTQKHGNVSYENRDNGLVFEIENSNGTKVEKAWQFNETPWTQGGTKQINPYVKVEFTSFKDASGNYTQTVAKEFSYDKNGNQTEIKEYDFLPYNYIMRDVSGRAVGLLAGVPTRTMQTAYNNSTPDATDSTTNSPNAYWNAASPNIRNSVSATETKDGSGNVVSRSEMTYDNPSTTGNLTEMKTWDSSKGGYSNPLTTGNSISVTNQYDVYGNVLQTTDAKGIVSKLTYGSITTPMGTVADLYPTLSVAAFGTAEARTTNTEYDFSTGAVKKSTDADNNVSTETEYDALARPVKVKAAVGTANEIWTQTVYDDVNRRVIAKSDIETKGDARKVGIQHFDQLGRVRLARTLEDAATQSATDETQGIKVQTRYKYDNPTDPANSNGAYTLTSNPYRAATSAQASGEESMGWSLSYADKTGKNATAKTYGGATLPAPFGANANLTGTVTTAIDANVTTVTDQAGKQRRSITNGLGQLVRVDEPDDAGNLGAVDAPTQSTAYLYDTLGKMVKVTQGVQSRFFKYDSLGRLLRVRQPEQETNAGLALADAITGNSDWSAGFTYDAIGNLLTATDTKGTVITSAYDNLNRVMTRSYSDSTPQVTYTYDDPNIQFSKGRLTKTSNAVSVAQILSLDNVGRVTSSRQTTDGVNYDSAYAYNLSGMLVEETYPSGRKVKNSFQTDGDLAKIETMQAGGSYATRADNFNYAAHGAIKHLQIGNGLWESAQFNNRLQVTQLGLGTSATDTSQWKLDYDFGTTDNNGNIKAQTVTSPVGIYAQSFTYDSLDRLKTATETSGGNQTWTQSFTYDRYGNRTGFSQTLNGNTTNTTPTIDANTNRFTLGQGYTYDAAGNVITDPQGRQFTFNGDNKQTEVKDVNNQTIGTYFYDGDGKRIKKVTGSENTTFVYSGGKLVAEYQLTTSIPTTATTQYLGTDMLGSPRVVSDQTGTVTSRRDFMPFGEDLTRANYGSDTIRQKFTGYEKDTETGLDFAEARYYNSNIGRFTAVDPLIASGKSADPQTFNRYSYTMNNPLIMTDPSGMQVGSTTSTGFVVNCPFGTPGCEPVPAGKVDITTTFPDSGMVETSSAMLLGTAITAQPTLALPTLESFVGGAAAVPVVNFAASWSIIQWAQEQDAINGNDNMIDIVNSWATGGGYLAGKGIEEAIRREASQTQAIPITATAEPPNDVPDNSVVVRGGQSPVPAPGIMFSGAFGPNLYDASKGVPHGSISYTTADAIRKNGGSVIYAPEEAYPGGPINYRHVNVILGPNGVPFVGPIPNPVPKNERIPGRPR